MLGILQNNVKICPSIVGILNMCRMIYRKKKKKEEINVEKQQQNESTMPCPEGTCEKPHSLVYGR